MMASDDGTADLQRRSPPTSSTPSPLGGGGSVGGQMTETEDEGPVIRMAATRARRPMPESIGSGNAMVMDTRSLFRLIVGRKLSRKINCGLLWLIKDCCGIFCCFITWWLIGYAEFVIWFIIVPSHALSYLNVIIWQCWASLALFSHLRCMFNDPGAIPIGNCTMENLRRLGYGAPKSDQDSSDANYRQAPTIVYKCPRCACIKPDKSHHCSICRRCIFKMDHHCPWVNNCVGMLNQKFFILFCLYIALMASHGIVIDLQFLFTCFPYIDPHAASRYDNDASSSSDGPHLQMCLRPPRPGTQGVSHFISLSGGIIFVIFMLFEAVIFALFTTIMFGTQVHALCTETTSIEQLKKLDEELGQAQQNERRRFDGESSARKRHPSGSKSEKTGCLAPLADAFGDRKPPNFHWLSPFHGPYLKRPGFLQPYTEEVINSATSFLSSVRTA